jgi:TfoX/Sxy family transcriptional regulator of competence genes
MKIPKPSAAATERLRALVSGDPRVQIKKMFGHAAAFVNGNLCVGTFGDDVFVRLSESDCQEAAKIRGARPFEPMPGRPMKQYLVLPPSLLSKPSLSRKWVGRSISFVVALPPKKSSARRRN